MNTQTQKPEDRTGADRTGDEHRTAADRGADRRGDERATKKGTFTFKGLDGGAVFVRAEAITMVRTGSGARFGEDAPAKVTELGVMGAGLVTIADAESDVLTALDWS